MKLFFLFSLLGLLGTAACTQESRKETQARKPNIVFILTDDLGYGDLGCYGQQLIETPHIDRMAAEGKRFTQFYAGATVCAPSRSALMTGQHTGHTYIRGNKEVKPEGQEPLADSIVTMAEVLKEAGYATEAFGKWGLGFVGTEGDPLNQGFDAFYGYNCQRYAHRYYPPHLWDNDRKVVLEGNDMQQTGVYAPDLIQEQALAFIEENQENPFFLFLPYTMPHAELIVPEDSIFNRYKGRFGETPYEGDPYGPEATIMGYTSQEYPRATFAAMVTRLDSYVGQVLHKLKEQGLDEHTLVLFASDNGPHLEGGADPDFFNSNGGLRGYKRDLYEGGIRSPLIAWWPGKVAAGKESGEVWAMWDLLPTFAELAGAPAPGGTDGISFLPAILDEERQRQHDYLYWEFHEQGGRQAVRKGDWKAVRLNVKKNPDGPLELYNLAGDPAESRDIAKEHPEIIRDMKTIMQEARTESELFPF